jgi:hypothetical protein
LAKRHIVFLILIAVPVIIPGSAFLFAQNNNETKIFFDPLKRFSVKIGGSFISSTELQNNITSQNPIERDASTELSGGFGYTGEFTFDPKFGSSGIKFFLSSEYFHHTEESLYLRYYEDTSFFTVRFTENFSFIPIETGIKWHLPISGYNLKVYIGGGAGFYFGDRKRNVGTLETTNEKIKPGFSLIVFSGIDYYFARNLSASFEFKFRDAYFEVTSKFGSGRYPLYGMPNPFTSRISVNGTALSLGLKYDFF